MGKKEANIPISGMSPAHPMNIKENEYPFMLNGNIQTDISSAVTLTNENSNILCFRFPEGFKVIGELFVPEENVTFLFLVNPTTGASQIGYLSEYLYVEQTDQPEPDPCADCGTVNIEQPPLETITQEPTCQYTCISQSACLNFHINMPIRRPIFKKDSCGSTLYFTDFRNPIRALKLNEQKQIDDSQRAITGYLGTCADIPETPTDAECRRLASPHIACTCCEPVYADRCSEADLDCIKIRLYPQVAHICVEPAPNGVVEGGSLRAGTYQLAACYADQNGERATRTFSACNPVSIFDPNQTISERQDYPTGLAAKFLINDLDSSKYSFIDIFVIGTINNVSSTKKFETIDITSLINGTLEYTLSDFEKGEDVSIDDVMQVFPIYEKAQEITSGGNTLILGNLEGPRDLNLQRAVIGMSNSLKWVSSEANEWFYKDGSNAANYRSYLRDEVYAFGIVFERNNTLDTCAYPLIGRAINTAFSAVETDSDPCAGTWAGMVAPSTFTSDPGYNVFTFVGDWIPTRRYRKRTTADPTLGHYPYEIVIYNDSYYICIAANTNVIPGTDATKWALIANPLDPCLLCVKDDDQVDNDDVLIPPGCEHSKADTPTSHDKRYEVYNTACNSGQICSPEKSVVKCDDFIEQIRCHSYRYSVPTASAWFTSGSATINLTVDPTNLGIFEGSQVTGSGIQPGTVVVGPIVPGSTLTISLPTNLAIAQASPTTLSFDIDCSDATGCGENTSCNPEDCYRDEADKCTPCADNYTTLLNDVAHCNPEFDPDFPYTVGQQVFQAGHNWQNVTPTTPGLPFNAAQWTDLGVSDGPCDCPVWPPDVDFSGSCHSGYVRTKQDALNYYTANGKYLLCADATLVGFESTYSDPFIVKKDSNAVKVLDASTKPWYVYDIVGSGSIQDLIIKAVDPTKPIPVPAIKGPLDSVCFNDIHRIYPPGPVDSYLLPGINMPSTEPENYDPVNGMGTFNPSPEGKCNDYGPTAPLMYMLGHNLSAPAAPACCPGVGEDCDTTAATGDFWNIGAAAPVVGEEINNSKYQSYWYSFVATAIQPTIIIKAKIGYKFGEFFGAGHTPAADDFQQQSDFRIDVYEGDPLVQPPTWSTGKDNTYTAAYYYDDATAESDMGVLVIGDVANSSGQATTAGQIPLIAGTTYYVHIYMLPQGIAKLDKGALANPAKGDACVGYDADSGSCCPCYFANYGYMNLCINSAISNETKIVSLPETWEVECKYDLHYREKRLIDHGCLLQTWEYGPFAFWVSKTKKYPNNKDVWGPLCQQPIRHFKFPDATVSYLQDQDPLIPMDSSGIPIAAGQFNSQRKAKIYPMGFRMDPEDVKAWLRWASDGTNFPDRSGVPLITPEEMESITGYKIVRGNRVGNKSIAAKGLLYDMWRYHEHDFVNNVYSKLWSYYPSYPFNDLRTDPYLNNGGDFVHPFAGVANNRFAFLSPDTTFNSPYIGYELKCESTVFGDSLGYFYTVKDHPKYTLLSNGGIALAATLAGIQLAGDLLIDLGNLLGQFDVGFSNTIPVGSIVGFVGAFLNLAPKFFIYARQWREIIVNFGVPQNFAKYYAATGNYHNSGELGVNPNDTGQKRRIILTSAYLLPGNLGVSDNGQLSKINNYQREDSVYLFLNEPISFQPTILVDPLFKDTSRFIMSGGTDNKPCALLDRQSRVASYYGAIKYDVPDQYGDIHDINWLHTGKCVAIDWADSNQSELACEPVFGGDTFISRMSQKRKIPFFLDNPVGADTGVDFQYQHISNITDATYYFNSVGESIASSSSIQFVPVEHRLDCGSESGLYIKGSMYLFSYGITSFICESDYNLNFRYAEDTKFKTFYPYQSDIEGWTQEYRVPIETPNAYLYNRTYSKQNKENFFCTQPILYNNDTCVTRYRNRVINSIPDKDSNFFTDPWRIFLQNDMSDFDLVNGQLMGLDGIEREKVLVRFDKTSLVFNAFYTIDTDAGSAQIGTGSMFAQKPEEYAKTDLGYGGTQHHAFTSTQYGHFWVDARRSAIFMLPPGGALEECSLPYATFFNNNLPFFILKAFPTYNVDNNYKDIGITLGWDNKFDRLFITKLDYELKTKYYQSISPLDYVDYVEDTFVHCVNGDCTPIRLTDEEFFCNKSWTVGYAPQSKSWISFYSFAPNYYISHENYFQTGINYSQSGDITEEGVWNHLITNKSYQVFYGKLYPFITDVVLKEELVNRQLLSIEYQADFLRFQNDYDYFYNPGVTFNKMAIWSENRNTGNLELVPRVQNDLSQSVLYPRVNPDSTSVLVTRKENSWRVNQFWDLVRNKYNNVPPMIYGCHPYLKTVNPDAIDYWKPTFQKSRLTHDYFTMRFINDKYSNYKIINKWFLNNTIQSIT